VRDSRSTRCLPVLLVLAGFIVILFHGTAAAQIMRPEEVVNITPALPKTGFYPGQTFQAAVVVKIMEGYHLNIHGTKDPILIPTELKIPEDSPVSWPYVRYPEDQVRPGETVEGLVGDYYYTKIIIRLAGRLPEDAEPGELKVEMKLYYQTCTEELCLMPVDRPFEFKIPVVAPGTEVKDINEDIFKKPGGEKKGGQSWR
jgi:hypothetical protein